MYIYNNNNFYGKINGMMASDLVKNMNYELNTINDRIEFVKSRLLIDEINGVQFPIPYLEQVFMQEDPNMSGKDGLFYVSDIDKHMTLDELEKWCDDNEKQYEKYLGKGKIKLVLNKKDSLYSDSNIARILESLGTYILILDKKKDNEEYIKVYHSEELFKRALKEERLINKIALNMNEAMYAKGTHDENVEFAILSIPKNFKKEKKFTKKDDNSLEKLDKKYGDKYPGFRDYYNSYKHFKKLAYELTHDNDGNVAKLNKEQERRKKLLYKHIKGLKEDMFDYLNAKMRPIMMKSPLKDSGTPSWDMYDELNKGHIKALLSFTDRIDLQDDLSVIIRDLNNTISECEFTDIQWNVLKLLRQDKIQEDIGYILNISQQMVNTHINAIVNKIYNKNLEKYTDWYYLNIVKGAYKKCSKCGEVKIIQQFNKEPKGILGVKSQCKQCQKK